MKICWRSFISAPAEGQPVNPTLGMPYLSVPRAVHGAGACCLHFWPYSTIQWQAVAIIIQELVAFQIASTFCSSFVYLGLTRTPCLTLNITKVSESHQSEAELCSLGVESAAGLWNLPGHQHGLTYGRQVLQLHVRPRQNSRKKIVAVSVLLVFTKLPSVITESKYNCFWEENYPSRMIEPSVLLLLNGLNLDHRIQEKSDRCRKKTEYANL